MYTLYIKIELVELNKSRNLPILFRKWSNFSGGIRSSIA